jgi:hypothetical protein
MTSPKKRRSHLLEKKTTICWRSSMGMILLESYVTISSQREVNYTTMYCVMIFLLAYHGTTNPSSGCGTVPGLSGHWFHDSATICSQSFFW